MRDEIEAATLAHDEIKGSAELWTRLTIPVGEMPDGDGATLELANCRVCLSTISRSVRPSRRKVRS